MHAALWLVESLFEWLLIATFNSHLLCVCAFGTWDNVFRVRWEVTLPLSLFSQGRWHSVLIVQIGGDRMCCQPVAQFVLAAPHDGFHELLIAALWAR